ncbi:MAG: nuclease-related domain-containing protein, partial [Myxococcota bacterium]
MTAQYHPIAQPRHELEAEALRFLRERLPNNFTLYSNIDLTTGRSGDTYEHDAIVVAPHAVFTVEIKSWGGRITGNRDRWVLADNYSVQSPIALVLAKARSLKGLLQARRFDLASLWVQGLVFLSAPDAAPRISQDYEQLVVTRSDVIPALTDPASWQLNRRLTPQQLGSVLKVLSDGAPARQMARLGPYDLLQRLEADERPYALWLGKHRFDGITHLLHVYTLHHAQETQRSRIRDLAMREKEAYDKLYGCPDLLRYHSVDIPSDADPACVVLSFEDTTPLLPLPTWVSSRKPRLSHRLTVAARIARALAHAPSAWVACTGYTLAKATSGWYWIKKHSPPPQIRVPSARVRSVK